MEKEIHSKSLIYPNAPFEFPPLYSEHSSLLTWIKPVRDSEENYHPKSTSISLEEKCLLGYKSLQCEVFR